jgi:hypothetical protein
MPGRIDRVISITWLRRNDWGTDSRDRRVSGGDGRGGRLRTHEIGVDIVGTGAGVTPWILPM